MALLHLARRTPLRRWFPLAEPPFSEPVSSSHNPEMELSSSLKSPLYSLSAPEASLENHGRRRRTAPKSNRLLGFNFLQVLDKNLQMGTLLLSTSIVLCTSKNQKRKWQSISPFCRFTFHWVLMLFLALFIDGVLLDDVMGIIFSWVLFISEKR